MTSPHHDRPRVAGPPRLVGKRPPRQAPVVILAARIRELEALVATLERNNNTLANRLHTARALSADAAHVARREGSPTAARVCCELRRALDG